MEPEEIESAVRAEGLLAPGRPVVVLLSGGRDSTCLLDLATRITGADAVRALHVNYRLRVDADRDERHCRELAARLGVELVVRMPNTPALGNVQAWARDVRYGYAVELASGAGGRVADIAAGHTASDQVETILYRLASSPSRRALLGMRSREGALIRPLLFLAREDTKAYCQARGLPYVDDPSNDSDSYARNRIRRQLVPALRAVHPAAERNVLALAEILRDEAAVLDAFVEEILGGRDQIELADLRGLPRAVVRLVVQRLADGAAGAPAPGASRRAEEILELGDDAALDLPHGVRARVRKGMLRFERTPPLRRAGREGGGPVAGPADN